MHSISNPTVISTCSNHASERPTSRGRAPWLGVRSMIVAAVLLLATLSPLGTAALAATPPQVAAPVTAPLEPASVARGEVAASAGVGRGNYATRQAAAKGLEGFKGGDTTVIVGGSALVLVLIVVLIVVLI